MAFYLYFTSLIFIVTNTDEVAHLKRAMSKRTETESGEKIYGEQKALLKQSDQMDKEKLIKV